MGMVSDRRGQTALEFLMTYGWAIIVVLAAIAALAYFGILAPDRFLPDKCTMTPGMFCAQYKIDGTNERFYLELENKMGVGITEVTVNVTAKSPLTCSDQVVLTTPLENDESTGLQEFDCENLGTVTKAKADIIVTYRRVTETVTHQTRGTLLGAVERE